MSETVVTVQPGKIEPPRQWSTGMVNLSCCLASWIPCLQLFYGFGNARMVGQPGFCASQGCLCIYCCCPCAYLLWTTKTRYYTKMRLGIVDGRNEMLCNWCCHPCVVGQTRESLIRNQALLAQQMWVDPQE